MTTGVLHIYISFCNRSEPKRGGGRILKEHVRTMSRANVDDGSDDDTAHSDQDSFDTVEAAIKENKPWLTNESYFLCVRGVVINCHLMEDVQSNTNTSDKNHLFVVERFEVPDHVQGLGVGSEVLHDLLQFVTLNRRLCVKIMCNLEDDLLADACNDAKGTLVDNDYYFYAR